MVLIFVFGALLTFLPLIFFFVGEWSADTVVTFEVFIALVYLASAVKFSVRNRDETGFREIFVDLDRVDVVLAGQAHNFATACAVETNLQKHGYKPSGLSVDPMDGLEQLQGSISEQKRVLLNQKERFWKAHGLAKKLGYRVLPSHKDYLSQPAA